MKCPKCQMNISDTATYCLHCGTQFNNNTQNTFPSQQPVQNNVTSVNMNSNVSTVKKEFVSSSQQVPAGNKASLAFSIINMVAIFPAVGFFSILFFLFAGFTDEASANGILTICGIYLVGSIIWVVVSIWNVAKYNKVHRIACIATVLFLALFGGGLYCYVNFLPESAKKTFDTIEEVKKGPATNVVNPILYEDDEITIQVNRARRNGDGIEIEFSLINNDEKYYNFNVKNVKIDGLLIPFYADSLTNNSSDNRWVSSYGTSDNYKIQINNYDLKNKNIRVYNVKKISLQLIIISSSNEVYDIQKKEPEEYFDIEFK